MYLTFLHGKIHNARVTRANLNYHGSLTIDPVLLDASGMEVGQQIQVYDSNNGARFETYIIEGQAGKGQIEVNGAAARMVHEGDSLIICTFAQLTPEETKNWSPQVVICDQDNRVSKHFQYRSRTSHIHKPINPDGISNLETTLKNF